MKDAFRSVVATIVKRWSIRRSLWATFPLIVLAACDVPGTQRSDAEPASSTAAPAKAPAEEPLSEAEATTSLEPIAATAPVQLRLEFTGNTWVDAVVDGGDRVSELHTTGEEMLVEAEREIVLTIGNGGAVRATLNGNPYPLAGESGQVLRDLVIKAPAESQ